MDKMKMHSPSLTEANITKLAALFPNCITEASDLTGEVKNVIDFDLLRQELSPFIVEGPQERYQLNWPGKREALVTANAPIAKSLRPSRDESIKFDVTKNIFIEGDNLDALKLLQETYLGKVKLIYIDPPYNTGEDFIYDDDFSESVESFVFKSNQKDSFGDRLVANSDVSGRFHSDWLSMMYARIKLARNLLSDDGVIFISIDDRESANLKKICDEIFGEKNFEAQIAWRRRHNQPNDKTKMIAKVSEAILVYAKDSISLKTKGTYYGLPLSDDRASEYTNADNDPKGRWSSNPWKAAVGRGGTKYKLTTPSGVVFDETWYGNEKTFSSYLKEGRVHWTKGGEGYPRIKIYLSEAIKSGQAGINFFTHDKFGSNQEGSAELKEIFGLDGMFDNPKPTKLLKAIIKLATAGDEIVMDFFAGTASFAHAVMDLNAEEETQRRFICVQLPECCEPSTPAFKAGYKSISDIGKERLRRAGDRIKAGGSKGAEKTDIGFRVLKIDSSTMRDVYYSPDAVNQDLLSKQINNIREDRNSEDLLFQVLLDWGVDLALPISQQTIAGKTVFLVDGNALVACFDIGIDEDFVKKLAGHNPLRAVFRDAGFASDSVKINVEQVFKLLSPTTEIKTI